MQGRVVAIGECMLELSANTAGGWLLGYAGDTFNTALYLARLGVDVAYLTALGTDPFSAELLRDWQNEGVDTGLVLTDASRLPGLYAIRTDSFGERSFYYWREAAAARRLFDLPGIDASLKAAEGAGLLYLSGITLSLFGPDERARIVALAVAVREHGGAVAFDPNYRPRGWASADLARAAIAEIAPHVTIALPTFEDEAVLHGDYDPQATLARWRTLGASDIAVKLGPRGALVAIGDGGKLVPAPAHVKPVDTTGAGDAFNAAYLAARFRGAASIDAARHGHRLAGEVVRHPGAIIPRPIMPDLAE